MKELGSCMRRYAVEKMGGSDFTSQELVHMVMLAYQCKCFGGKSGNKKKDQTQLNFHRDVQYSHDGSYSELNNSQVEGTPTFVLTVGDTRKLAFKLYRHTQQPKKKRKTGSSAWSVEEVEDEDNTTHVFELTHGSLFVLHPDDERSLIRREYDTLYPTFFKHGNVVFGRNGGLSIGLVFRTTAHVGEVSVRTGQRVAKGVVALSPHETKLAEYMSNTAVKKRDDEERKQLCQHMVKTYFK